MAHTTFKIRATIEFDISGVDEENIQSEIETAMFTWDTPIIQNVELIAWQKVLNEPA